VVEAGEHKLVFDRVHDDRRLRCTFNLSATNVPHGSSGQPLFATGSVTTSALGAYAAIIEEH
jgi:hypothetical protein